MNHKDHDRKNNNVLNLEWVTMQENLDYSKGFQNHLSEKAMQNSMYGIRLKQGKYEVGINHKYLGRYETLEQAQKVKEEYVEKHYYKI